MDNYRKQIKCPHVLSRDIKDANFGKMCLCKIAELDGSGRLVLVCPDCGQETELTVREVVPNVSKRQVILGSNRAEAIKQNLLSGNADLEEGT